MFMLLSLSSSILSRTRFVSRIWYGLQNVIKICITRMVTSKTRITYKHVKWATLLSLSFSVSFVMLIELKQNPGQVCHLGLNWYSPSGSIRCVNYTTNWCVIAFNNCCFEMSIRCFNYGRNGHSEAPLRGTVDTLGLMMTSIPVKQWISIRHQLDFTVLRGTEAIISAIFISDSLSDFRITQSETLGFLLKMSVMKNNRYLTQINSRPNQLLF